MFNTVQQFHATPDGKCIHVFDSMVFWGPRDWIVAQARILFDIQRDGFPMRNAFRIIDPIDGVIYSEFKPI